MSTNSPNANCQADDTVFMNDLREFIFTKDKAIGTTVAEETNLNIDGTVADKIMQEFYEDTPILRKNVDVYLYWGFHCKNNFERYQSHNVINAEKI